MNPTNIEWLHHGWGLGLRCGLVTMLIDADYSRWQWGFNAWAWMYSRPIWATYQLYLGPLKVAVRSGLLWRALAIAERRNALPWGDA